MKKLLILALIILVSAFSFPQNINVTFQVDMSIVIFEGLFPAGANVVVRGNFQTDAGDPNGLWQGNMFQLSDTDDDSIYTGTFQIPSNFVGNNYIFKYVIVNPPAGDNWESINNRPFTLTSPATVIPVVWFNDDGIYVPPFEVANTLNFTADISSILGVGIGGAFDPNQDSLLVMGLDWDNLGKNVVGNRKMVNDNILPGIYTTTLTVTSGSAAPYGVGDSTKWRFKAYPDSRFQNNGWETGSDRWHIYEADGSTLTLPTILPIILPNFPPTQTDVDFTLYVDMTDAINRYNGLPIPLDELEFVGVRGTADFLGSLEGGCWCADDTLTGHMKVLTNIGNQIWSYHTTVPAGTMTGRYQFRLGAMYPGADTVNGGLSYLNNEFPLGVNHSYVLTNQPTAVSNNWFGYPFPPDDVEQINNLIPDKCALEQNYPNPFNPATKIRYSIPEYSYVTLKVFNLLGEEIETLFNGEKMPGVYEASFDASNLSSGIYFYSLQTRDFSSTKKMILLR